MPNENMSNAEWADIHTTALVKGMISIILSNRIDLRAIPELEQVSSNGGDRINKKLIQILTRMADQYPGCQGAVKELIAETGRKKKGSETPSPSKKRKSSQTPTPSKMRKETDTPTPSKKRNGTDTPTPSKMGKETTETPTSTRKKRNGGAEDGLGRRRGTRDVKDEFVTDDDLEEEEIEGEEESKD